MGFDGGAPAVPKPPRTLVFASQIQATLALTAVATSRALPSVTIPAGLIDGTIVRVTAAMSWRKQVDSSGAPNALVGAQNIQVRSDAPGTFTTAIILPTASLSTALSATEGGDMIEGTEDIKIEVVGADIYEFQWTLSDVTAASLTFHDIQTWLFVEVSN